MAAPKMPDRMIWHDLAGVDVDNSKRDGDAFDFEAPAATDEAGADG
jgi:hypothetical protein